MADTLTPLKVKHVKPRPGKVKDEIADGGCAGLFLRVQASGHKSWGLRYRFAGASRNLTLGNAEGPKALTLLAARAKAAAAMEDVGKGIDPVQASKAKKEAARKKEVAESGDTIENLFNVYLVEHAKAKTREASWTRVQGTFKREILPRWGRRMVRDITRKEIRELVYAIARTRPVQGNRVLAHLGGFFRWCEERECIDQSPCLRITRPTKEAPRQRTLNKDEIRSFWAATDELTTPFNDIFKLLLVCGQRRQEVADMKWDEVRPLSEKVWRLPGARSKSRVPHYLPLGPLAWEIIERQPHVSSFVFARSRSGFAHFKAQLDAAMQTTSPWVTHDLRRTFRDLLSEARVPDEIAELCICHLPNKLIRTYSPSQRLDEKRQAFQTLEHQIDLILHPRTADVIDLRR